MTTSRKLSPDPIERARRPRSATPVRTPRATLPTAAAMAAALALLGCHRARGEATPDLEVAPPPAPKLASTAPTRAPATLASASAGAASPRPTPPANSAAPAPTAKLALRPRPPADDDSELLGFSGIGVGPIVTVGGAVSVVHPAATPSIATSATPAPIKVSTSVDASTVTETALVVAKGEPRLRACADASHLAGPTSLAVAVVVDEDGHVESANVSGSTSSKLTSCVGAAFYAMQFRAGVSARAPFTAAVDFTPDP